MFVFMYLKKWTISTSFTKLKNQPSIEDTTYTQLKSHVCLTPIATKAVNVSSIHTE